MNLLFELKDAWLAHWGTVITVAVMALVFCYKCFPKVQGWVKGRLKGVMVVVGALLMFVMMEFFSASQWIRFVVGIGAVVLLIEFYKYYPNLIGRIKSMNGYEMGIVVSVLGIALWLITPFALRNHYPRQIVALMQESVDTVEKMPKKLSVQSSNGKTEVIEYEAIQKEEHSRIPAIFILVFSCSIYTVILGILIGVTLKLAKQYKRDKVLKGKLNNIIDIIGNLGDDGMVKEYQKKILDKYMSVWIEEQEE